jgi:hypothetical protein
MLEQRLRSAIDALPVLDHTGGVPWETRIPVTGNQWVTSDRPAEARTEFTPWAIRSPSSASAALSEAA